MSDFALRRYCTVLLPHSGSPFPINLKVWMVWYLKVWMPKHFSAIFNALLFILDGNYINTEYLKVPYSRFKLMKKFCCSWWPATFLLKLLYCATKKKYSLRYYRQLHIGAVSWDQIKISDLSLIINLKLFRVIKEKKKGLEYKLELKKFSHSVSSMFS